ncbi:hypothetical protein GOA77_33035 [Sinorhizobium meliloti]|nr:hypothetical protein [Sinorhizobium meliloti]MDW9986748.1 hypothetical protein [Sinorhizobium meliloti]MDX0135269.1 hypothetical protein [Sinorhizobium meliloti]MDX0272317.1 hypothetical protein [Sinorhizobium meliloti]RVP19434.1 hypothetical protein CN082_33770 [Sinorhizobium meliloti]
MRVPRSSIWIERHKRAAGFWLAEDYFTGAKCIGVILREGGEVLRNRDCAGQGHSARQPRDYRSGEEVTSAGQADWEKLRRMPADDTLVAPGWWFRSHQVWYLQARGRW